MKTVSLSERRKPQEEDAKCRQDAQEIARRLMEDHGSVSRSEVRDPKRIAVLGYLLMEHEPRVVDRVAELFREVEDPNGQYARLDILDREIGLHSGFPECCVDFYMDSHERFSKAYPFLSPKGVSDLAVGVRHHFWKEMKVLPREDWPSYHTCPECTRDIVLGLKKPNVTHKCTDLTQDPLCALWRDQAERRPEVIRERLVAIKNMRR